MNQQDPGVFENDISKNYVFEGYQVFQLKDALNDLYNPDKAFIFTNVMLIIELQMVLTSPTEDSTPIANLVNYSLDESIVMSICHKI